MAEISACFLAKIQGFATETFETARTGLTKS